MSTKEFAQSIGVPLYKVHNWQKRGMPYTRATGASIDKAAALEWLREKKKKGKRKDAFNIVETKATEEEA